MAGLTGSKRLGGGTSHATPMTLAECRKRIAAIKDRPKKELLTAAEKLELKRLNTKVKSGMGLGIKTPKSTLKLPTTGLGSVKNETLQTIPDGSRKSFVRTLPTSIIVDGKRFGNGSPTETLPEARRDAAHFNRPGSGLAGKVIALKLSPFFENSSGRVFRAAIFTRK